MSTEEIVTSSYSTKQSHTTPITSNTDSRNLETEISTVQSATAISSHDPSRTVFGNSTISSPGRTTVISTTTVVSHDAGSLTTSSGILDRETANTVTTTSTISSNDKEMTVTSTTTIFNQDDARTVTNNSTISIQGIATTVTSTTTVYSRDSPATVTTNEVTFTDAKTAFDTSVSSVGHDASRSEYADFSSSTELSDIVEIVSTDEVTKGERLPGQVTTMDEVTRLVV